MKNPAQLLVSPNMVPANASIKIQLSTVSSADCYQVTNEKGELVRRGMVADPSREFSLSVCGMACGHYWMELGGHRERFTVV
jgi:hypothetical protein